MSLCTGIVAALALCLVPQQAPPEGGEPTPAAPVQPVQPVNPLAGSPTDVASKLIPDITEHRGGAEGTPYVRRFEDARWLDLSRVDFEADVIARIGDHEVTRDEYERWLAFTAGIVAVQHKQLEILMNRLLERAVASGEERAAYEVTDADVDAQMAKIENEARAQGDAAYDGLMRQIEAVTGYENFKGLMKVQLLSEKLLLPRITKDSEGSSQAVLPPVSAELLSQDQTTLRDYLAEAYVAGTELPDLFRTYFLKMLQSKLVDNSEIVYAVSADARRPQSALDGASDGAPAAALGPGEFMSVAERSRDGEAPKPKTVVTTREILDLTRVNRWHQERALRLLLTYHAVDDALADKGALLDDAAFDLAYASHEAEFEGTLIPLKNMIMLRGFLSEPEYREYFRRRAAFQKMVQETEAATLEEAYRRHHERYARLFLESGKVTAEILFMSLNGSRAQVGEDATDLQAKEKARERMLAAMAALGEGRNFSELRATGEAYPGTVNGQLFQKLLNELRAALNESEYSIFMSGYSLADDIFYNRVENEVVGPVPEFVVPFNGDTTPLGWVLAKVVEFRQVQPLKDYAAQKPLVVVDYFSLRYLYFASECFKNAVIELTEV